MKLTPSRKAGLVVIAVGLLAPIAFFAWSSTIRRSIVDLPLPLHPGVVRQDFSVDYDGHYIVGIEMDKNISRQTTECLFGAKEMGSEVATDCGDTPAVLNFSWQLIQDDQIVWTSTSAKMGSGPSSQGFMANLGLFQARRGHRYGVLLDFAQDASKTAVGQPRLRIILDPWTYEEIIVGEVISEGFCFVCLLAGGLILGVSWWRARRLPKALPSQ
jgi:hypothetical protein